MPVKIELTTEKQIISTPLPTHGGKYAVIPHQVIINKVKEELKKHWLVVKEAKYKSTVSGNIAQGIYHLNYAKDPEMGLMFAWSNSYDKTQKFKCGVGAYVTVSGNGVMHADMMSAARKHLGATAQDDAFSFIKSQISHATRYYNQLVHEKELMKKIILSKVTQACIAGRLFLDEGILTLTQMGIVKREMEKPSHSYNADPNSAWSFYNNISAALKESHPTTWLDDHSKLHDFFINEYNLGTTSQTLTVSAEPPKQEPAKQASINYDKPVENEPELVEEELPTGASTVVFL